MGIRPVNASPRSSFLQNAVTVFGLLLILLSFSRQVHGREPVIDRIDVVVEGTSGEKGQWESLARDLIPIRENTAFDPEKLARALERLKQSGLFSAIHVPDPDWSARPFVITFNVTPFPRIKDIRIHGAFPLLEREVISAIGLSVGRAYSEAGRPQAEAAVTDLFRNQGFIDPKTVISAEPDPADGHIVLDVRIDKGDYYSVRRVDIEGNRTFSEGRLLLRMRTWQASALPGSLGRFSRPRFDEDVRSLIDFYYQKGFAEAEISPEVTENPESGEVDVQLRVSEGPRYIVVFEGNRAFWDLTLKSDMVIYTEGNPNDLGIRKSVRKIRERYAENGYNDAKVDVVSEPETVDGIPVRRIRMLIDEGPKDVVKSISIAGNSALSEDDIREVITSRPPGLIAEGAFTPDTLDADRREIQTLYLKEGFTDARVTEEVTRQDIGADGERPVEIRLSVDEGSRVRVEAVNIEGLSAVNEKDALDALDVRAGDVFRDYMIKADEITLATLIAERGYPHVTVTGRAERGAEDGSATVTYTVTEGPFVQMGELYTLGNLRTRRSVIENEMELQSGDPFSLSKMLASQRNIRSLNALDRVRFSTPGLAEQDDEVHLLAEVEERKSYFLQFGLGFDTDRRLFLNSKAGDRNLFGLNKEGWLGLEVSEIGYQGEINITEPRFLGTRISATAGISAEEREDFNQDFGVRSIGSNLTLSRGFGKHWSSSLGFRFERREQFLRDDASDEIDDEDIFDPRAILVTTPTLNYNSTDSFVRPRTGAQVLTSVDLSTGLQNSFDNFVKYRLDARWYTTPLDRLTFAVRGRVGYLDPLSTQSTVPEDQLFFLGGLGSVRGFDKNELRTDDEGDAAGGRTEILGSVEARLGLWGNIEGVTFYDIGSVQSALGEGGSNRFRSSAGAGLRYVTPIGPIGVLYGFKLDRESGESAGALHFSIGYTF